MNSEQSPDKIEEPDDIIKEDISYAETNSVEDYKEKEILIEVNEDKEVYTYLI